MRDRCECPDCVQARVSDRQTTAQTPQEERNTKAAKMSARMKAYWAKRRKQNAKEAKLK